MTNDQKLMLEIESRKKSLIELTQDLIRMPTVNPPCANYLEICEFLKKRLEASGFETQLIRAKGAIADSDKYPRWNIVAKYAGKNPGDCVHFNSHTDVVEVGHGWTKDPFGGELHDGKIYGRGACDMKGGLATSIIAAEAFIATYPDFNGSIEISGTADEESGGFGGVAYLAEKGFFKHVNHVIIPEPLNKDRVCIGHRGVWWAEVETKGRIAHGSMPFLGDCAVRHMGAVLEQLEEKLYPALKDKKTTMPVVPDGAKESTLNINSIHGGEAEQEEDYTGLPSPNVPDRCRIVIDRRFLIEEKLPEVKSEIYELLNNLKENRQNFDFEIRDMHEVHPTMAPKDAPVVTTISNAIKDVLGKTAEQVVSPGTYDQKHIDRIGKLDNCIAYGPGILDLAHQPDEWIGVDDMIDSAKIMGKALTNFHSVT
ncbi:MAG: acetylornithine deacetylase/succinyl-diaminopimelate desuccinylase family protein [Rhodobacteraceae bacterium]|nr:MAG: acetylornithine deacetylase/succinyl-diaminopimelate desuccinylase family protein [Paracoccaceae bacterium]